MTSRVVDRILTRLCQMSNKRFLNLSVSHSQDSVSKSIDLSGPSGSTIEKSAAEKYTSVSSSTTGSKANVHNPTLTVTTKVQSSPGEQSIPTLNLQPSGHDIRKETSSFASHEKSQAHILRTSFDQALGGNPNDDVSLLASRRIDPSTVRQVYYFDTLAFTKKLEASGFSRQQAEGCAECLVEIINTTLDHQGRHMVTKPQQEIAVQQLLSEIVSVKKDMTLLQKSEFSSLKTETEKMSIELSQVQNHIRDEIVKLKGQLSLDINLERGRAIEAHAENEKKLQQLHNKIETEIANLKTIYEIYRNDVFKYAGGTVIAVGGLMLGVIRVWN